MAAIPFSLVGILPAHAALGAFFTATSMIGFIAGAGIVVRNSIILVDFIELRLREGMPLREAVVDAGAVRFRPMVLTAAAVIVGAGVILFDPIFQGLAVSLMAGEVASLLLSRMAVPVLYYMVNRRSAAAGVVQPAAAPAIAASVETGEGYMTVERALRLIGGGFVALSVGLGIYVSPWFFAFTLFVAANLIQSAFSELVSDDDGPAVDGSQGVFTPEGVAWNRAPGQHTQAPVSALSAAGVAQRREPRERGLARRHFRAQQGCRQTSNRRRQLRAFVRALEPLGRPHHAARCERVERAHQHVDGLGRIAPG